MKCDICGKEFPTKGISTHIWRMHGKGKKHDPNKGRVAWNKGLTKDTSEAVERNSSAVSRTMKQKVLDGTYKKRSMSVDERRKLSEEQSLRNRGGKSKWFEVDGKKVQGTWEKFLAEKMTASNIRWDRAKTTFKYLMGGKERTYTPDFFLFDYNIFIEVKGYWWGRDKEKMCIVKETYPSTKILIIEKDDFEKLQSDFSYIRELLAN